MKERRCVKSYPSVYGCDVHVEFIVHYVFLGMARVTPVRGRMAGDSEIQEIPPGRREWICTSGIGWFPLEEM